MKKIVAILLILISFTSCNDRVTIEKAEYNRLKGIKTPEYPKKIHIDNISPNYNSSDGTDAYIVLIDGCEYIYVERQGDGGPVLTHKGNCKNIHHNYLY